MSIIASRHSKRKGAKETLKNICERRTNFLIVHYSCQSFYNIPEGKTPRITSIAVKYYDSSQTKSFSIHKVAETKNIPFDEIDAHYDTLERSMLDAFYDFINRHSRNSWIHLNMRDINYGFEAINHRYSVLGGVPTEIEDYLKIDLGRLLVDLYGNKYIEHPRFEMLCKKNNVTMMNFLSGKEEAEAFENCEYVRLHQSILRKVDNMQSIIERSFENDIKINSNLLEIYGLTPQSIFILMQEHWIFALIMTVVAIFFTKLIEMIFQ